MKEYAMNNQVKIKFKMDVHQDNDQQVISFESIGTQTINRVDEDLIMTLSYQEPVMEGNGTIDVKMTFYPNQLTVLRKGEVKGMQKYQYSKVTDCFFSYEYGKFPYQAHTHKLDYSRHKVDLTYDLLINGSIQGSFIMKIEIIPQEGVEHNE